MSRKSWIERNTPFVPLPWGPAFMAGFCIALGAFGVAAIATGVPFEWWFGALIAVGICGLGVWLGIPAAAWLLLVNSAGGILLNLSAPLLTGDPIRWSALLLHVGMVFSMHEAIVFLRERDSAIAEERSSQPDPFADDVSDDFASSDDFA